MKPKYSKRQQRHDRLDSEANFRAGGGPHENYIGQFGNLDEYFRENHEEEPENENVTFHGLDSRQGYGNRYSNRNYNGGHHQQREHYNYEDYPYQNQKGQAWDEEIYPGKWVGNQPDSNDSRNYKANRNYGWDKGMTPDEKFEKIQKRKASRAGRTGFGGRS